MGEQVKCSISGLVQGVGYRWFVFRKAGDLHITGWVRNSPDGSVECLAQGPRDALESLVNALRHGPRSAMVQDVSCEWSIPSRPYDTFDIR